MGTPDIAAQCLEAIVKAGNTVCGVFTREDKPIGRKQVLTPTPVKQIALHYNIPVFQPKTLKESAEKDIESLNPDLIVVVAYGRIIPGNIIQIPRYGVINLHVSLLPKYRGAAPIQWAIINGEIETGVSIMYIDEGLDTGDIISQKEITIGENETTADLFKRITEIGAEELLQVINNISTGAIIRIPQNHNKATYAPPIKKEMAYFTFDMAAKNIHNLVRGMNPWPVAYFVYEGKKVKVLESKQKTDFAGVAGEILSINPFVIACGQGAIELKQVLPEGSKSMLGSSWARGKRFSVKDNLIKI